MIRHGLRPSDLRGMDSRRFWLRANKTATGCWEYAGPRGGSTYEYGRVRVNGRITGAHRIAYVLYTGRPVEWPNEVCHHCDNGRCVNPGHLYLGTQVSNNRDRHRRARGGIGSFVPAGEIAA